MEVIRGFQRHHEAGQQLDRPLDVVEVRGFHHRVHAAQRQRNQRAGNPLAHVENLVGIGAGEAAAGLVLHRDLALLRHVHQPLHHQRMVGSAVRKGRAAAELHRSVLVRIEPRGVRRVGDVEADTGIREMAVSRHHRAVATDLLLHRVADPQAERGNFLGVRGSDIDPQLVDLRGFLVARAVAAQVDRGVADDPHHRALVPGEDQPPAARRRDIAAADPVDPQEAIRLDRLDHEADLVRVGRQHHGPRGFPLKPRPGRAVGIAGHFGGDRPEIIRPHPLAGHLEAGGAGRLEQGEKEFPVVFRHPRH